MINSEIENNRSTENAKDVVKEKIELLHNLDSKQENILVPWNKQHIPKKQRKNKLNLIIYFLLFLMIIVLSASFFLVKSEHQIIVDTVDTPEELRYKIWLKEKLRLANLPYDPEYMEFSSINENNREDNKENNDIILNITPLSQSMLIEHAPDEFINNIKDNLN